MSQFHDLLDVAVDATPAQAKVAYHRKLREFPAHTHPTEFKEIRSAYEAIQKGETHSLEDFFEVRSIDLTIEPDEIQSIKDKLKKHLEVSLEDLLRATF